MKKRYWVLLAVGIAGVGVATAAYVATPTVHEGAPGDATELGRPGDSPIGTRVITITVPNQLQLGALDLVTGGGDHADRSLSVRLWYPSVEVSNAQYIGIQYRHEMNLRGVGSFEIVSPGIANPDAEAASEGKLPLVVMSHGYGGWSTQFSNLAEHIASRGYVVASIEHADMVADDLPSFLTSFSNVLLRRSLDQRAVFDHLRDGASTSSDPVLAIVDADNTALIGYSMGGYGALATAGAAYDFEAGPIADLPLSAQDALREGASHPASIKSVVTFAPWGGQPDNRAWSAQSLEQVEIPVLMIAGNQDDVVNFDEGVNWLFENLTGAERHLLVYREARHNIVGNAYEARPDTPFQALEFMTEPVWRGDRLNAINQHFVAAFLDLTLKEDGAKRAYLEVPTVDSNNASWDTSLGEQLNGRMAGSEEEQFWRGFQNRWAVGLEMHTLAPGEKR